MIYGIRVRLTGEKRQYKKYNAKELEINIGFCCEIASYSINLPVARNKLTV
jgi:hypothetical protein